MTQGSAEALYAPSRMKVIIREAAYDDLDRIYAWIARDRPRTADSVIERILESGERLA
jgi:plasmid stabilization system protein ParE